MAGGQKKSEVYLEAGAKRVVAAAIEWPGWCRSGKDEADALDALVRAAPRYAAMVDRTELLFEAPVGVAQLSVRERVAGNAATAMGVPNVVLPEDIEPMSDAEVERSVLILRACWAAFDAAVRAARGKELRKGPRGGGRELDGIARHVAESEVGYTQMTGLQFGRKEIVETRGVKEILAASREKVLEGLAAVAPVGLPPPGPKGGARWPGRYFVRRVAYHVVDHVWEIEDRSQPPEQDAGQ